MLPSHRKTGRSALDAAELMNVGVNYLREHVSDDVRMHYAYLDNGIPANVVPDIARTNYLSALPNVPAPRAPAAG